MTEQKGKGKGMFAVTGIITLMLLIIGIITTSAAPPPKPHTVYGFVFDSDKKPVSEEQVILLNPDTGDSLQTATAKDGSYTFELANLPHQYKNGDLLKVQVRTQEVLLTVDTSVGLQKVDDTWNPRNLNPILQKAPIKNPTLTNSSSPEQRRPSSIPEFSTIAIPVGITLLIFFSFFISRSKSKRRK